MGYKARWEGRWTARWASISNTESEITAEEVVGTHLCRILDSVPPLPRSEASSVRSTNLTTGDGT